MLAQIQLAGDSPMNTELEKWINDNREKLFTPTQYGEPVMAIKESDLRALFTGKALVPVELLHHKPIGKYSDDRSIDYNDGWNDCIDEITASQEPKQ